MFCMLQKEMQSSYKAQFYVFFHESEGKFALYRSNSYIFPLRILGCFPNAIPQIHLMHALNKQPRKNLCCSSQQSLHTPVGDKYIILYHTCVAKSHHSYIIIYLHLCSDMWVWKICLYVQSTVPRVIWQLGQCLKHKESTHLFHLKFLTVNITAIVEHLTTLSLNECTE